MRLPVMIPVGSWREPVLRVDGPQTGDHPRAAQRVQLSILRPGDSAVALFLDLPTVEALVEALVEASDGLTPDAGDAP